MDISYFSQCPICRAEPEHIHVTAGEELVRCTRQPEGCGMPVVAAATLDAAWKKWEQIVDDCHNYLESL